MNHQSLSLRSIIKTVIIIGILCIVFGYIFFQARFVIAGPVIAIETELKPVYNERIVLVSGSVRNSTKITLNGREIFTDEQGYFQEPLVLENGYTIMVVRAEDRFGRTTEIIDETVYRPASAINL